MGARLRQIRRRIRSVQSTMKITRAMEQIALARIARAQRRVQQIRSYAVRLTEAMEDVARQTGALVHPLLEEREPAARAAVLVMTSDRGLAGAYNANVLRRAERLFGRLRGDGIEPVLFVVGRKGQSYFRFRQTPIEDAWSGFRLRPVDRRFVPIAPEEVAGDEATRGRPRPEYIFEPAPAQLLDALLPRYVTALIFAALLECAATENAEDLIRRLTREANQARQTEITTELMEIVGGAEALRQASGE